MFGGGSARGWVSAALMVDLGWTAVTRRIMSGPDHFVLSYNPKGDPAKMVDGLGERYEVTMATLKRWTTGGPHPIAARQRCSSQLKKTSLRAGRRETSRRARRSLAPRLHREPGAVGMPDICLQHMVAVMIIDKAASFKAAHDQAAHAAGPGESSRLHAPSASSSATAAETPSAYDPPSAWPSIEVTLNADGTKPDRAAVESRSRHSGKSNEPRRGGRQARDLIVPVLGATKCDALIEKLLTLENVKDIRELRPLLQRA